MASQPLLKKRTKLRIVQGVCVDGSLQESVPPPSSQKLDDSEGKDLRVSARPMSQRVTDPLIHKKWATAAWEAIEYAFIRFPNQHESLVRLPRCKNDFITLYAQRSLQGTAIKWLKFHCSYAFAVGVAQTELATAPYMEEGRESDGCICPGLQHLMHHSMKRAAGGNWAYRRFLLDLLYAKNGMPPAMEGFIRDSLQSHKKALTQKKPSEEGETERSQSLWLVERELRREVRSLFKNTNFQHSDEFPSSGSSFDSSFQDGGTFRDLLDSFKPPMLYKGEAVFGKEGVVNDQVLVACFQDYVDKLWMDRLEEPIKTVPVALLEPLKVRVITKGMAAEYYRVCELQKFMHGILRHHPVFQYIGSPIDERSFSSCFPSQECLLADEFFVSGDYDAATDNLNPTLSEAAWEEICQTVTMVWNGLETLLVDTPYYQLGKKALTGHLLFYKEGEELVSVNQTWGQLMGSPMSFPILCLVNSAATHAALGLTFSKWSRMRVNGDDIAFIANPVSYARWKVVVASCGLKPSIGKNYTSREFIIMNSELRRIPHAKPTDRFYTVGALVKVPSLNLVEPESDAQEIEWHSGQVCRLEGFFNQSIARSLVRKGITAGRRKDVYWTDLQPLATALLRGISKKYQSIFLEVLLKENASAVAERPKDCNLYFPRCLGGVGLPVPIGQTPSSVTAPTSPAVLSRELKRAAYLATQGSRRLNLPTIGTDLSGPAEQAIKAVRKLGPKRVPVPKEGTKREMGLNKTQLLSRTIQVYLERGYAGLNPITSKLLREGLSAESGSLFERSMASLCGPVPGSLEKSPARCLPITQNRHRVDPVTFGEPLVNPVAHHHRLQTLNHKYSKYVNGCYSMSPMTLDHAFSFEETEMLDSLWPILGCQTSERLMDTVLIDQEEGLQAIYDNENTSEDVSLSQLFFEECGV